MACAQKVYRFRLEPTVAQARGLVHQAVASRWVWNWALARRRAHYQARQASLSFKDLSTELSALKAIPETAWLQTVDSQLLQQSLRDLQAAFNRFFAKDARFPWFKRHKRDRHRFRIQSFLNNRNSGTSGIPSVLLENTFPDEKFEECIRNVFRAIAPGDAFILGVAAYGSNIDRVERISQAVEEQEYFLQSR